MLKIINGQVVTQEGVISEPLWIEKGIIAHIGEWEKEATEVLDAENNYILPGGIDGHVHFNDPREEPWEGWYYGTCAAAAGGITTVIEMPLNGVPPVTNLETLQLKKKRAKEEAVVNYALLGGLVSDNLSDLSDLDREGCIGFKCFMADALDFPAADDAIMYEGMKKIRNYGKPLIVHPENQSMTNYYVKKIKETGRSDWECFGEAFPEINELEAINRALFLGKQAGVKLHIAHVSQAKAIEMIDEAKREQKVTVETCPHYLFFDSKKAKEIGCKAICTPPMRDEINREQLWKLVLENKIDNIVSDHAPCAPVNKPVNKNDVWNSWTGINGIQTMISAVWTEGEKRGLTIEQLVKLFALAPSQIYGLYPRKGAIREGADADIIFFNPNIKWTFTKEMVKSRYPMSPYIGMELKGKVEKTLVNGKVVFDGMKITGKNGSFIEANRDDGNTD